ncbi:MAG: hypothetical protein JJE19_05645 [Methanosarcinales archaeon]|nr:hypothetical protein [Methanosarcinales archaeon]
MSKEEITLIETDEGHFYRTPCGILPSVTTILQLIPKPALEIWKQREPAWRQISEQALKVGSLVHEAIDAYLKGDNLRLGEVLSTRCDEIEKPFSAFLRWKENSGFKPLSNELGIWSKRGYAGTADMIGHINSKLYLVDLKTAKRIYPDYLLQVSAYRHAYEERTGERIEGLGILRLDKAEGFYEWKGYSEVDYESGLKAFLHLCEVWHSGQEVSNPRIEGIEKVCEE